MSDLVILAYRRAAAAFAAAEALAGLQKSAGVELEDIVVVTRDEADSVQVNHLIDRVTGRTLAGGEWGTTIGMLFLTQDGKTGAETGLAAQFRERGVDPGFLRQVAQSLTKGGAAVGLRRRFLKMTLLEERLKSLAGNGTLFRTKLDPETEERLLDLQEQIPAEVLAHVQANG